MFSHPIQRRKPLPDGMVTVNRAHADQVTVLFSANSTTTSDGIFDENTDEDIKARARNMVNEYRQLYDVAVLYIVDKKYAKVSDAETKEFEETLRERFPENRSAARITSVRKMATDYESLVGGMDQFMRQIGCLAKTAALLVCGCGSHCNQNGSCVVLQELYSQWEACQRKGTAAGGKVLPLPYTIIVCFELSSVMYILLPMENSLWTSYKWK